VKSANDQPKAVAVETKEAPKPTNGPEPRTEEKPATKPPAKNAAEPRTEAKPEARGDGNSAAPPRPRAGAQGPAQRPPQNATQAPPRAEAPPRQEHAPKPDARAGMPTVDLKDLKDMSIQKLNQVAKDLSVPGTAGLRK